MRKSLITAIMVLGFFGNSASAASICGLLQMIYVDHAEGGPGVVHTVRVTTRAGVETYYLNAKAGSATERSLRMSLLALLEDDSKVCFEGKLEAKSLTFTSAKRR